MNNNTNQKDLSTNNYKKRSTIPVLILLLFIYSLFLLGHLWNYERYYYDNPQMLAIPLIIGPVLVYLFYRFISKRISKRNKYDISVRDSKKSKIKDEKNYEEIRRKLFVEGASKYRLLKLIILMSYIFFATYTFTFLQEHDFFSNQYAIYLVGISFILCFLFLLRILFTKRYIRDYDERYQEVYNWIKENSYDSYGQSVVSTKDIAEHCNMSQKEIKSICFYHHLIHKADADNGEMWTLYPNK